jgi:hypothetical protein
MALGYAFGVFAIGCKDEGIIAISMDLKDLGKLPFSKIGDKPVV